MKMPNVNFMSAMKTLAVSKTGRILLKVRKASPEILIVVGIGGVVYGVVKACQATLKLEEVVDNVDGNVEAINRAHEKDDNDSDRKKEVALAKINGGFEIAKLYAPSVIILASSVGCIIGSHRIMHGRNLALMAAYKELKNDFDFYRKNVVDDAGTDKDEAYRLGLKNVTTSEKDEDVKEKKVTNTIVSKNPYELSQYARFFDESSNQFSKTPEYNKQFLLGLQAHFNDLLKLRGHVFLNEVYDALDIPRSQAGQVVGWIYKNKDDKNYGKCDGYIDFGIFTIDSPANRSFVNGNEEAILLDFNVDGVIYDMI